MTPEPFRIEPKMPAHAYKTYAISSPITSHTRPARCEEVNCPNYINGWRTVVATQTDLGVQQAKYIEDQSGRHYTKEMAPLFQTIYTFPAGQQCFAQHRVPLHREPLYVVRDGDHRGNPTGVRRVHAKPEHWVEDFASHQAELSNEIEKG